MFCKDGHLLVLELPRWANIGMGDHRLSLKHILRDPDHATAAERKNGVLPVVPFKNGFLNSPWRPALRWAISKRGLAGPPTPDIECQWARLPLLE